MSEYDWHPVVMLRWSTEGKLQQHWKRRVSNKRGIWYDEFEWRDVPRQPVDEIQLIKYPAQETRPDHTAAHDCACAECVKAERRPAPTEHAIHGGRIMTLRECMEAEETLTARRQPDYSKGPITHDCTGAGCTDESHSLNR